MNKITIKQKLAGLTGALLLGTLALTGFGAAAAEPAEEPSAAQSESAAPERGREGRQADRQELLDKWDALTDSQKQELYDLAEARMNADMALLQKLAQDGLLDGARVSGWIARMQEAMKQRRESGAFPLPTGRHGRPHKEGEHSVPEPSGQ